MDKVTERTATESQGQTSPRAPLAATDGPSRAVRARGRHPLLGVFPLTVMTLATFLVLFTLMMARLTAGADPALRAGNSAAVVRTVSAGSPLSTRTSGGAGTASTTSVAASQGSSATVPAVLTRSSGGAGAGVGSDD